MRGSPSISDGKSALARDKSQLSSSVMKRKVAPSRARRRRLPSLLPSLLASLLVPLVASAHKDAHPFQRGICYASAWRNGNGYGSAVSQKTLQRLHALGVE